MILRRKVVCLALLAGLWCAVDRVTSRDASAAPAPSDAEEEARILQLAQRASFGATRELLAEIRKVGRSRWIAQQVAPAGIADPELARRLAIYPALTMDSAGLIAAYPQGVAAGAGAIGKPPRILAEVSADVLVRAVHARAQLAEVMTDFWLNHFNVYGAEGPTRYSIVAHVRDTIRPHVLGRFRDLLRATAESPAMLYYLDNYLSSAPTSGAQKARGLNENYARELLELHTLGVEGGYTQADVVEVARVFTGWTITLPRSGHVDSLFLPKRHEPGAKTVLGRRVAAAGRDEGLQVLDMLAAEPATAEHLARKLVSRFVADVPPEPLVARVKDVYLRSGGDIGWVVATILTSDEFSSAENRNRKTKSPLELMASVLRAVHADVRNGVAASRLVGDLGQPILRAQPPTGWGETAADVVTAGGMVTRFDVAYAVASGAVAGVRVDVSRWTKLAQSPSGSDALVQELLPGGASQTTRAALDEARAGGATPPLLAALALSSPEFQQQ